jgi:hypothetical protein
MYIVVQVHYCGLTIKNLYTMSARKHPQYIFASDGRGAFLNDLLTASYYNPTKKTFYEKVLEDVVLTPLDKASDLYEKALTVRDIMQTPDLSKMLADQNFDLCTRVVKHFPEIFNDFFYGTHGDVAECIAVLYARGEISCEYALKVVQLLQRSREMRVSGARLFTLREGLEVDIEHVIRSQDFELFKQKFLSSPAVFICYPFPKHMRLPNYLFTLQDDWVLSDEFVDQCIDLCHSHCLTGNDSWSSMLSLDLDMAKGDDAHVIAKRMEDSISEWCREYAYHVDQGTLDGVASDEGVLSVADSACH